jgi:hypothetical protein
MRLALVVGCLGSSIALASSAPAVDFASLVRRADRVVLAKVGQTVTSAPDGEPRRLSSVTHIRVLEDLAGQGPQELDLVQLGGTAGEWTLSIAGAASFASGELAILVLRCREASGPRACTLVGLGQGRLPVVVRPGDGQREVQVPLGGGRYEARGLRGVADEVRRIAQSSGAADERPDVAAPSSATRLGAPVPSVGPASPPGRPPLPDRGDR